MRITTCGITAHLIVLSAVSTSPASILTFDITDSTNPQYAGTEDFPEGYRIDGNYGDRITGPTGNNGSLQFGYGVGSEGYTPNVTVQYGPESFITGGPELWRYNYGDLDRVLYQGSRGSPGTNYNILQIILTADPGYKVELFGFDLGSWFADRAINLVSVFDGIPFPFLTPTNQIYESAPNITIYDDAGSPQRTSFTFTTPLVSDEIWIVIDANNLGDDSELIGIDNIQFGQVIDAGGAVPEPMSFLVWGALAAAGLVAYRRCS